MDNPSTGHSEMPKSVSDIFTKIRTDAVGLGAALLRSNSLIGTVLGSAAGARATLASVEFAEELQRKLAKAGEAAQALGYGPAVNTVQSCSPAPPSCVDKDGYLKEGVTKRHIGSEGKPNKLEQGDLTNVSAIVLHRTAGSTGAGALSSFESTGIGTHFVVDKDGTVFQTASLNKYTSHVGKIKARCAEEGSCTEEEAKALKKIGFDPAAISSHESTKFYPDRYPRSIDSVGIEVVGAYNDKTKTWDVPTGTQKKALKTLVDQLKSCYSLNNDDIYGHDKISYKTPGEGDGLYDK